MFRALLFLRLASAGNFLNRQVQRLRKPQYLLAAAGTAAYFYYACLRPMNSAFGSAASRHAGPGATVAVFAMIVPILAILLGRPLFTWLAAEGKAGLSFSEAEIAFLFPAPISRRGLIHYHLLNAQVLTAFSAIFLGLLSGAWALPAAAGLFRTASWWVVLATVNLHQAAAALTVARMDERGIGVWTRRAMVIGLIGVVASSALASAWLKLGRPGWDALTDLEGMRSAVRHALNSGIAGLILWPLRSLVAPFFARTGPNFILRLGPALLILAVHYLWALRMDAGFEEASIALAQKRSAARAARQAGRTPWAAASRRAVPEPFPLGPSGRQEVAIVWKNLLSIRSSLNPRLLLPLVFLLVVMLGPLASMWRRWHGGAGNLVLSAIAAIVAFYVLLIGPQYARQDFRSDLQNADLMKSYPMRGWQIAAAQVLAPAAVLTSILLLCILVAALTLPPAGHGWLTFPVRWSAALCLAAVSPLICLLQLLAPNAAALLFPSWQLASRAKGAGIEVIGQRLIFLASQLLLFAFAMLPAALSAVLIILASSWLVGTAASLFLAAAAVIVILGTEVAVGIWVLGWLFERFDVSAEPRA